MTINVRKLNMQTNGPDYFGVVPEQELIRLGYVWEFNVFDESGLCIRTGLSSIKSEDKLRLYINSGMSRVDWEALHGKD